MAWGTAALPCRCEAPETGPCLFVNDKAGKPVHIVALAKNLRHTRGINLSRNDRVVMSCGRQGCVQAAHALVGAE